MSHKQDALLQHVKVTNPALNEHTKKKAEELRALAEKGYKGFWAEMSEGIDWFKHWEQIIDETDAPYYRWYLGGKLNASYNCLDRHVASWKRNKAAIIFEGELGEKEVITYGELYRRVNHLAAALKDMGITKGDVVTIFMPMIPQAVETMLACARIGAVHSVVFGGFSPEALRERIQDAESKVLITADGGYRRGKVIPLKANADAALKENSCPSLEKVIVTRHTGAEIDMESGRDIQYEDLIEEEASYCEPEVLDSEDELFILYSSGTTSKPKGILHTVGGYMVGVHTTFKYVFDHRDDDIYWCTADIGWITGHSYIVYGPLSCGSTVLLYEGSPDYPDKDRFWEIIEKYGVNIFYTAPTAIRMFMRWGEEWLQKHDLSSLRLLGSVGEPINPEAWMWFFEYVGNGKCPIMDTWWQTETGGHAITPLPGDEYFKPGAASSPFPGIEVDVVDEEGLSTAPNESGYLVITSPWPSMLRNLYQDSERYVKTYWEQYEGMYFSGDGAKKDEEGDIWIIGRVDDLINVSGHRIGTMEIESALVSHSAVVEAAVIGRKDEIKGQAVSAFVLLKHGYEGGEELVKELKQLVAKKIGALARPEEIYFIAELPKTRSGKIMRRLLRDIAEGKVLGDTTSLTDPGVISSIKGTYEKEDEEQKKPHKSSSW